jgi:SAM-dependent methyltransferase
MHRKKSLTTYLKLCTEFYDLDKPHNHHSPEFQCYLEYAEQAGKKPILEPMCGSGRLLIPLLQAGFDIYGFDASAYMLDALKHKYPPVNTVNTTPLCQSSNRQATIISTEHQRVWQQFVQDFISDIHYQLIFIPFGSFGLITNRNEAQKALTVLYQHLAPCGKLVLEIETIASLPQPLEIWRRGVHSKPNGSKIAINALASYDPATQIYQSLCRYELIVNNTITEIETEDFQQYLYRFDELDDMLKQTGFSQVKKYQSFTKEPATNTAAQILLYECTKDL